VKNKKVRNTDFMAVSEKKFKHMKEIALKYGEEIYKTGEKHDANSLFKGFSKRVFFDLIEILYSGYCTSIKATNDTMNQIADYCNERDITLPFPLIYKMQAFLEVLSMVEFMLAVDHRKLLGEELSLDDQCKVFESTIDKGFSSLRDSEEETNLTKHFLYIQELIQGDGSVESIAEEYKRDIHHLSNADLGFIVTKFEGLLALSKSMMVKSYELSRLESIVATLVKLSRQEVDRRRVNN
jgi:hypothetical protein